MKDIILDVDPGIDDAAAIAVAINHPELNVKLITTVAGNVSVDKTTKNTLKLLEFFNKSIPVASGAEKPLFKKYEDASAIHGESGMPGYNFPEPKTTPINLKAVDAIHEEIKKSKNNITIIATGAYTNIALFIQKYKEDFNKIDEIILMGGSVSEGNVSSVAEFNVFTDPDAAKIVFDSPIKKTMIGLDVTMKALITNDTLEKIATLGESGKMLKSLIGEYKDQGNGGKPMHDVNTILYAVDNTLIKTVNGNIDVAVKGPAIGATVWDFGNRWHDENTFNTKIGIDIDASTFNKWFIKQIENMNI